MLNTIIILFSLVSQNPKYPTLIPHDFTPEESFVLQKDFELVEAYYEEFTGNTFTYCPDLHIFHVDPKQIKAEYEAQGKQNVLADYLNNKARINRAGLGAPRATAAIHEITHHFNHCNGVFGEQDEMIAQQVEQALKEDLYEATNANTWMQRP